jgi:hypothetical protein
VLISDIIMKKTIALLFLLLPFSIMAQMSLLHPGMTLSEFHQSFPKAVPDISAMTCSVYGADTMAGQAGHQEFTLSHDTVKKFYFQSVLVSGPSIDFPKADSAAYSKMMVSVREMYYHYTDMFGTAAEVHQHSPIVPKKMVVDAAVFYAHWNLPEGEVKMIVSPLGPSTEENLMNAPVDNSSKKTKSAYYTFEVFATGKGGRLRGEFEIGAASDQFRSLIPSLASQVKKFPDCWMVHDTLAGADADWRFWFENNVIAGFAYDTYNGDAYGKKNAEAYPILMARAKAMESDAEKQFGKPSTLVAPPTNEYVPLKKISSEFFYDNVYYNAEWILPNEKTLFIRLHENGGKSPAFFHLEVYFGKVQE